MNTFVVSVESAGFYQGHNVKINGVQAFHRPYDGKHSGDVEHEVAAALGELLREKLRLNKEAPPEEDDNW